MKRIASFSVNHNILKKGMYISRIDGDIVTYDIRMKIPNAGDYIENKALHTIEHLFATFARNTEFADNIIYIGPMGCRTGFYFLVRNKISSQEALKIAYNAFVFISNFKGEIPGTKKEECGNYLEHDISSAKKEASAIAELLKDWTVEKMTYPQ